MAELFVIEAVHKKKQFEELLRSMGIDARVQATSGHLFDMPELRTLGIDAGFHDFARTPIDPKVVEWLRKEAAECERVIVATDADREGDVIAWDVAELVRDLHPETMRVRLKAMDVDSVREAISEAGPVSKRDAVAGRTRAIVDRMIGATFTGGGVSVGRVSTALLGIVREDRPVTRRLRLVAPSKDGGRPWTAECDVKAPLTADAARRLADLDLPALEFRAATKPLSPPPANMGEIMVRAGDRLDMSPKEAEASLQGLYEAGKMSYPRASAKGISRGTLHKVAAALKRAGYKFDESSVAEKSSGDAHDAPHPIGKVELSRDPVKLGHDEGVRTMVARDLVKSGQAHVTEVAGTARIVEFLLKRGFDKAAAEHVGALHWRRENGPNYPGKETWPESEVIERRPDTVLLEAAMRRNLGRPSTWATHIGNFMGRGLVDGDLNLTDKGRQWIAASPPALLDPRVSVAIENACEKVSDRMMDDPGREPWEMLAERIVTALPEGIRQPLVAAVASEAPKPRVDHLARFAPTVGLEEALERRAVRAFAPPR